MTEREPLRMCIACRARKPQRELVRVARQDGVLRIDDGRHRNGRGAYLCRNRRCVEQAEKRQALRRALGGELTDALRTALCRAADETEEPSRLVE